MLTKLEVMIGAIKRVIQYNEVDPAKMTMVDAISRMGSLAVAAEEALPDIETLIIDQLKMKKESLQLHEQVATMTREMGEMKFALAKLKMKKPMITEMPVGNIMFNPEPAVIEMVPEATIEEKAYNEANLAVFGKNKDR